MSYCAAPPFEPATGSSDSLRRAINRVDARPERSGTTRASRWLGIALIAWLAGAIAGFAMLPESKARPEGHAKPPATFPIDIQVPTAHDLPAIA